MATRLDTHARSEQVDVDLVPSPVLTTAASEMAIATVVPYGAQNLAIPDLPERTVLK